MIFGLWNESEMLTEAVASLNVNQKSGSEIIKLFFMLNSVEHEIFPAHKC